MSLLDVYAACIPAFGFLALLLLISFLGGDR